MGRVPIWAQWSIIGAGVLLFPLLMLLLACITGWLLFCFTSSGSARPPARGTSDRHACNRLLQSWRARADYARARDGYPYPTVFSSDKLLASTVGPMPGPQIRGWSRIAPARL